MTRFWRGRATGCRTLLLIALVALGGCGTGNYEAAMKQGLAQLNKVAGFAQLYQTATAIPDSNISVRLPKKFPDKGGLYVEGSPHPQDGNKIDPRRLQPPFLKLPGFKFCIEGFGEEATSTYPYYVYLAAAPAGNPDNATLEADLQAALKQEFPGAPDGFETVMVITPEGGELPWKRIVVAGEQFFDISTNGRREYKKAPGVFELWIHEGEAANVLLGWRVPEALDKKMHLGQLAQAAAGTLTIQKPDVAVPPDGAPAKAADAAE